jgi:hypothetical protein
MLDGGKIIGALAIVLLVGAGPVWLGLLRGAKAENPALPSASLPCALPREQIRGEHPVLLTRWREQVVRFGERVHRTSDGRDMRISLTGTCLGCHGSSTKFCDTCHAQTAVTLSCWQCHAQSANAQSAKGSQ